MEFILAVLRRTWLDTISFFGWNRSTLVLPFLFLTGAIIDFLRRGWNAAMDEVATTLIYGLVPVGAFTILLFIYNLILAPARIYKDQSKVIESHQAKYDPAIAKKLKEFFLFGESIRTVKQPKKEVVFQQWYAEVYIYLEQHVPELHWHFVNARAQFMTTSGNTGLDAKIKGLGDIITEYDKRATS